MKSLSRVRLFATPWAVAHQAPLSMEFFRREYWSRLPFPSPGDLPDPGVEPGSPALQADPLPSEPPGKPHCNLDGAQKRDAAWKKPDHRVHRLTPFTWRSRKGRHWRWQSSDPRAVTESSTGTYGWFLVTDVPSLDLSAGHTNASIWQKPFDCILKQGYIFLIAYVNRISIKLIFYEKIYSM